MEEIKTKVPLSDRKWFPPVLFILILIINCILLIVSLLISILIFTTKETSHKREQINNTTKETIINSNITNKNNKIQWPNNELSRTIPKPMSDTGISNIETQRTIDIYFNNISIEEFKKYVIQCQHVGYKLRVIQSEKSYTAEDIHGNKLYLKHELNNHMRLILRKGKTITSSINSTY